MSANNIVRVEAEFDRDGVQLRPNRRSDPVEQAVHHLECGGYTNRSLGNRGAARGHESVTFSHWFDGPCGRHGIGQRDQLSAIGERGWRATRDRGDVEVQSGCIATRTEKRGVSEQSIEAFVEIRGTSGHKLDLSFRQLVCV